MIDGSVSMQSQYSDILSRESLVCKSQIYPGIPFYIILLRK